MIMKKKLSLVLAFIFALSVAATGCKSTDGDTLNTIPTLDEGLKAPTETSAPIETEPTDTTTETTTETTTVTTEETTAEETTAAETSETQESETTETAETTQTEAPTWSETAMSATMYVTENCYSRERAIIGSTPISQYYTGDSVEIVAITDTDYYKLSTGGFIHSDYLSDSKPVQTVTEAPQTEATTAQSSDEGGNGGGSNSSSGEISGSSSYNTSYTSRYAYKQLTATEQELYRNFISAAKKLEPVVDVPEGMSSDDVVRIYSIVYNSEPQLFWLGTSISAGSTYATISFKTTDKSEIASMQKEIDNAAANIVAKANNYSGTISKLKVVFDTIVTTNDFSVSSDGYNTSIYNGITGNGKLQCQGYAKTAQYLCDLLGIDCMVVLGTNEEGESHAWNIVYCENGWYNFDTTWGDPINKFGADYVTYEYFLVPDAWTHNISHFNVNILTRGNGSKLKLYDPPACTKSSANYFDVYNKLYDNLEAAEAALYAEFDNSIANGKNVCEIRVTTKELYDKMMSMDYAKKYQKYCKGKSDKVEKLVIQDGFTKGVYVVHYDIVFK
ncbi:MAG: transglutaminase domain-containing protein [Huintestinicola sp.]